MQSGAAGDSSSVQGEREFRLDLHKGEVEVQALTRHFCREREERFLRLERFPELSWRGDWSVQAGPS